MLSAIELKTRLTNLIPDYRFIDASMLSPFSLASSIIAIKTKVNIVLFTVRSASNIELYNYQDIALRYQANTINACIVSKLPDVWIYHGEDSFFIDGSYEHVQENIQRWLKDTDRDICFICYEPIDVMGLSCHVCLKSPCNTCWLKMNSEQRTDCPMCRTAKEVVGFGV